MFGFTNNLNQNALFLQLKRQRSDLEVRLLFFSEVLLKNLI